MNTGKGRAEQSGLLFTIGHIGEWTPGDRRIVLCFSMMMRMRAVYIVNCWIMFVTRMQMALNVVVMHVLVCVSLSRSCWTKRL